MYHMFRCKQWVINIITADLEKYSPEYLYNCYTLCANHFEDNQVKNCDKRNSLIHNAVPTIFDIPNLPPLLTPKRSCPMCHIDTCEASTSNSEPQPQSTKSPEERAAQDTI